MHPGLAEHVIFWGKICGAVGAIGSFGYGAIRSLVANMQTKKMVETLTTNHIPHVQASIDAHTTALQGIKGDVRELDVKFDGLSTRLDDTRGAVHTLGESFLRHVENASQEKAIVKKKRNK